MPNISPGAATDLLVQLIIRVLDASTVSIEIEPAQVLATREYVDRKLDAHNKDGGTHEMLARKSVEIKAGTGLTGGGTLEATRTLAVSYGNTAGTACQGNDARLSNARTPAAHAASHKRGGCDPLEVFFRFHSTQPGNTHSSMEQLTRAGMSVMARTAPRTCGTSRSRQAHRKQKGQAAEARRTIMPSPSTTRA